MVLSLKSPPVPREKPAVPQSFAPDVPAGVQETSPDYGTEPQQSAFGGGQNPFQNPAIMSALMQFGINLASGQGFGQSMGAAGAAAGRVMDMQMRQDEYDLRAGYAAEDQAMQRGRYNMALADQEAEEAYRTQVQENADRTFDLNKRNTESLIEQRKKGGAGGVSATTLFSNEQKRKDAKRNFVIKQATEAAENSPELKSSKEFLSDPAFVKEAEDLFESLTKEGATNGATTGAAAPPPAPTDAPKSSPVAGLPETRPPGMSDQQLLQQANEIMRKIGNDAAKRQIVVDYLRRWGVKYTEAKNG